MGTKLMQGAVKRTDLCLDHRKSSKEITLKRHPGITFVN